MNASTEQWTIETRNSLGWGTDTSGPHILYDARDEALSWAVKLRTIHQDVRLKHTVTDYEEVIPS